MLSPEVSDLYRPGRPLRTLGGRLVHAYSDSRLDVRDAAGGGMRGHGWPIFFLFSPHTDTPLPPMGSA